jgi:hypothetical protein
MGHPCTHIIHELWYDTLETKCYHCTMTHLLSMYSFLGCPSRRAVTGSLGVRSDVVCSDTVYVIVGPLYTYGPLKNDIAAAGVCTNNIPERLFSAR